MVVVIWAVAVLLALQLVFVIWNVRQLPAMNSAAHLRKRTAQTMSILIPARNEEQRIGDCLASIAAQDESAFYGGIIKEIIVLDDQSEDDTAAVVRRLAEQDCRIRLIQGKPLPSGWSGKCYACAQLAEQATGEWLMFLDADARLFKDGAAHAAFAAEQQGAGLLTGFPLQQTVTWLEKLVVPTMLFTIANHLPIRLVRSSRRPQFVAAHGGFMLIHAESYRGIGGHEAVKDALVDDMELAKAVKRAGLPVTLFNVNEVVWMRMYERTGEVWHGYRKNLYSGLGRNVLLLAFILFYYGALYLLPCVTLLASFWENSLLLPSLISLALGAVIKRQSDRLQRKSRWLSLFMPAAAAALGAIAVASWLGASVGNKGYTWKGRMYR